MATLRQARKAVYDKWIAEWPVAYPAIPFTFDNEAFVPPGSAWARVAVREQLSIQQTLGPPTARKFQRRAAALIQLFVPRDTRVGDIADMAQAARAIFEGKSFDGLDFFEVTPREVPTEERWFQMTVEALFNYYETK